jgi:hypothetical protein
MLAFSTTVTELALAVASTVICWKPVYGLVVPDHTILAEFGSLPRRVDAHPEEPPVLSWLPTLPSPPIQPSMGARASLSQLQMRPKAESRSAVPGWMLLTV